MKKFSSKKGSIRLHAKTSRRGNSCCSRLVQQRRGVPVLDGFEGGAGLRNCGDEAVAIGRDGKGFDEAITFERQELPAGLQAPERHFALAAARSPGPLSKDNSIAVGTYGVTTCTFREPREARRGSDV